MTNATTVSLVSATAAAILGLVGGLAINQPKPEPVAPPVQVATTATADVAAAAPVVDGARLVSCEAAVASIDPGTPAERVSSMRCDYQRDGAGPFALWLTEVEAAKVREAMGQ